MEAVDPPFLITELEGEVYSQTGRTVDMALADLLSLTTEWVETERILITATVDLVAEARVVMDFPAGAALYSGGSGKNGSLAYGGGSYNSGTDQSNTAGANEGHGKVIITLYSSSSNPSQSPVITQGAGPLSKTIDEDTNATWTASELNATDSDTQASSLAWSLLTSPTNGTATVSGNGSAPTTLSYQPNGDYHGADSFSVQVTDGENNDSITINLTISPVDDATTVSGDTQASIAEDTSASGDLNATDADGLTDGSYFSISSVPANGSASIDPVRTGTGPTPPTPTSSGPIPSGSPSPMTKGILDHHHPLDHQSGR